MRVLFVYKYLTIGGVETVLRSRLDVLPKLGVSAEAWFLEDGPGRVIFDGIEDLIHVGTIRELTSVMHDYDLLVSMDTEEVFDIDGGEGNQRRWIVEFHTPYRDVQSYLKKVSTKQVAAILTPSEYQSRVAESLIDTPIQILVVPNPLRREFVDEPLNAPSWGEPIIGWIGRMDELKNWKGFISLSHELLKRRRDVSFWLIGDSPSNGIEQELEPLARDRDIYGRLYWFRNVDHQFIPRFLDLIRCSGGLVVSTSLGESFGMTIAEAMARSCAVVAPGDSPFSEFVRDGSSGFLFDGNRPSTAVEPIMRLLDDDTMRTCMGERGREAILQEHHPAGAAVKLADVLKMILRKL